MKSLAFFASAAAIGLCALVSLHADDPSHAKWDARAAAAAMDSRMDWWLHWPNAARDHDTTCVSCHTAAPYAIARPALRALLGEREASPQERAMTAHVVKRVRLWKEVEPFYPDQARGLPKSSESRGTEAVLNALVLAARDAADGALTDDARQAFANMWALQFTAGDLKGAWAWLNFQYEPWEAPGSPYYGAALAAVAIGRAPGGYASTPEIQNRVALLRDYLRRNAGKERLFNRLTALWASATLPNLLTAEQRDATIADLLKLQQPDGGWSMATLGTWKRIDETALETASDGYATAVAAVALEQAGAPQAKDQLGRALAWLVRNQDASTGQWRSSSLNKKRDPASDAGKFMSDAATAYAALALAGTK